MDLETCPGNLNVPRDRISRQCDGLRNSKNMGRILFEAKLFSPILSKIERVHFLRVFYSSTAEHPNKPYTSIITQMRTKIALRDLLYQ